MIVAGILTILHTAAASGIAHNNGKGGEFIFVGTREQWEKFADKFIRDSPAMHIELQHLRTEHDAQWMAMFKRRVHVEQLLLDVANGKRNMPTPQELREWALHLGTPDSKEPA